MSPRRKFVHGQGVNRTRRILSGPLELFTASALALAGFAMLSTSALAAAPVTGVGLNNFNQATPPGTLSAGGTLAAGREFSLYLQGDGTVVGWGDSGEGRSTPPAGLSGVIALSSGIYHTLALKSDGTIAGWGYSADGLLDMPPGLTGVYGVAAGGYHSLALRRDGTVIGWGFADDGRTTPPSNLWDVIAIDAGRDFSVALKADGTVAAWGLDDSGQTDVPAGLTNVVAIAAGENHTLALKDDGTVVAWGLNDAGQTTVPSNLTNVVAISAGAQHSMALKSDGTVKAWGDNSSGQLTVSGSDIRAIAAGGYHSLALHSKAPLITKQPHGQSALSGSSVTLSATATGTGLTYQWKLNGQNIAGATSQTLVLSSLGRGNGGVYTVTVSNANGSVTSQDTVVIVRGRLIPGAPKLLGGTAQLTFSDEFGDAINTASLGRYSLEASTDLVTWSPTNQPFSISNGKLQVSDSTAGQFHQRFYRVKQN